MSTILRFAPAASSLLAASLLTAAVPEKARELIDGIMMVSGSYIADEGAYKFVFPREASTIVSDDQYLPPNLGLNSWFTFSSAIHREAILTGEFLLLTDEVNVVMSGALDNRLAITGLADSTLFAGPRLYTLDFSGFGRFEELAAAVRRCLDEIQMVRKKGPRTPDTALTPPLPRGSATTGPPLDDVLAIRGAVTGGVYRAAIGRKALLRGDPIGREMGMSTWFSFAGTDSNSLSTGEIVATADELQNVLKALRMKGVSITSIRNHTLGEHPQFVFVRFWAEGPALGLARALRFVLEVQVGATKMRQELR